MITFSLLTLLCPTPAQEPAPAVLGELGARMDEYVGRLAGHGFSGVAVVARDGELVLAQGYGLADRARGVPVQLDTAMPLGSISKHFTAAVVLRLEADGALSLADPLEAFFEAVPEDKRGITVHQLLSHTAGFPEGGPAMLGGGRERFVRAVLAGELTFPPGARFGYSNVGYGLLAAIVEVVSGVGFEELLIDELFAPLGMEATGALAPAWPDDRIAHGYIDGMDVGTKPDHLRSGGGTWGTLGAGGLSTTALDMVRWTQGLDEGGVLAPAALEAMMTSHAAMGPDMGYGYGCGLSVGPSGWRRVGHTGSDDVFSAVWRWFPEQRAFLFVAGNDADAYAFEVAEGLERLLAGGEVSLAPAVVALSADELARYAGTWQLPGGGTIRVEASAGGLRLESSDFEAAALLHPVRRDQVARRRELSAALAGAYQRAFAGELEPLRELIEPFTPPAEFAAVTAPELDAWTRELGAFESARAVPGRNRFGEIALVCVLAFEAGERHIEYAFGPREVGSIRFLHGYPRRVVRPLGPDRFLDYDAQTYEAQSGAGFAISFRLEDDGRPLALVLAGEDGSERELMR